MSYQDVAPTLRQRTFNILEHSRRRDLISRTLDAVLVLLILANVAATIAQTIPEVRQQYGPFLQRFELLCLIVFTVEYSVRLWAAPEHLLLRRHGPAGARLRFAKTPLMLIDGLALLPGLLELLFPASSMVRLTRLIRFLKLARYSPALGTIGRVISAERRALMACIIILVGVLLAAAAVMMAVEGGAQPGTLGDMPKAMWWAASMLAKIGGGEFAPVTALGRIVSAITVMLGIFCFALPVAILGRGFYEEIRRRDFVVTFAMVARVPLFAQLDAASIADLVGILQARTVPAGTTIVRKGERGDAMYLIASGVVEVSTPLGAVRLGEGDFFGEMALVSHEPRSATVITVRSCDLLVLNADDCLRLMDRSQIIRTKIEDAWRQRRNIDPSQP